MPTITPGYDFGTAETPNFHKFMLQAAGLTVEDLDFSDLPIDLLARISGETSGSTGASLPGEGWMWTAPTGEVWVETAYRLPTDGGASGPTIQRGAVPLFRPQGGWCSNRWRVDESASHEGEMSFMRVRYDNDERLHRAFESDANFAQQGGMLLGVYFETGASGARTPMVGRGPFNCGSTGFDVGDAVGADYRLQRNISWIWRQHDDGPHQRFNAANYMGRSYRRGTATATTRGGAWLFSGPVYGP